MQEDTYQTIRLLSEGIYKEKGSKFLAFAHPVDSVEAIKDLLDNYRKTYYDARHVCYAYALGADAAQTRSSDDGEPSNTAGRPILGQIRSFDLTNVLVVVIRYFGGILLGTGGLVVAYKAAALDALQSAEKITKTVDEEFSVRFDFVYMNDVMKLVKSMNPQMVSQDYGLDCSMNFRIRKRDAERFKMALAKIDTLRFEMD
ncbi:MAG TPA: YigZ family protein [Bacteroidales bacterium]|nr:YigZ family protein [Bacteroidales bacterium]